MKIAIRGVVKRFGAVTAVDRAELDVADGELFTLLGPSGCGKTTLLRLLAGFYQPDAGEIHFGERKVSGLAPYERNIGMVFQNYALWPHMTVAGNVSYGLRLRKLATAEVERRVREGLAKVNLGGLESRYPGQLSGGQQQRVALARALVLNPDILLLDEPLSNLDAKIRVQVRAEIRKLQQELGITTIYVTHDQEEALSLSDRVAVMKDGRVLQVGVPRELYERPRTRFVADFVGTNNLVPGRVRERRGERLFVETALGRLEAIPHAAAAIADRCVLAIRPENVAIQPERRRRAQRRQLGGRARGLLVLSGQHPALRRGDGPRPRPQGRCPRSLASRSHGGGPGGDGVLPALGHAGPSRGFMTQTPPLPKLELAHAALSEEAALALLAGHRISLGGRTMDPKAQIVGEFVKSIRVPGYYPPLPELRQQLRDHGDADGRARARPRADRGRPDSGSRRPYPRPRLRRGEPGEGRGPRSPTSTAAAGCRATSRPITASARASPSARASRWWRSTTAWPPSTSSRRRWRIAWPPTPGSAPKAARSASIPRAWG